MNIWDAAIRSFKRFMRYAPPSDTHMVKMLWPVVRMMVIEALLERKDPVELAAEMEHYLDGYSTEVRQELASMAKELYDRLDRRAKSVHNP